MPNRKNAQSSRIRPRARKDRLMGRFFEPLVLQHVLNPNVGQRISRCPSDDVFTTHPDIREMKRAFLDQLSYVCDHIKGGDTVTAIALENKPSEVIFWVACNTDLKSETERFLKEILNILRRLALSPSEHSRSAIEDKIAERCIDFNLKRIKNYQKLMQPHLQKCLTVLANEEEEADSSLAGWLETFQCSDGDLPGLCRYAFQQRSSQYMKELRRHIGDENPEMTNEESHRQDFLMTRHFIGRIGSHLKAAKILTMAGLQLPRLFDYFSIRALPSPRQNKTQPPTDHLTTLSSIVTRMISSDPEKTLRYQQTLENMDTKFNIQARLQALYKEKTFRPRVHAELNLLEYFYENHLQFVDNDKFIGCSKPACYCCYHYISLHPGGFVRPDSHGIRYLHWRPPGMFDDNDTGADTRERTHQKVLINKLIAQIRSDTLLQIDQYDGPTAWRPDSTTGITYSTNLDRQIPQMKSFKIAEHDRGQLISNYPVSPEEVDEVSTLMLTQMSLHDRGDSISNFPVNLEEGHKASTLSTLMLAQVSDLNWGESISNSPINPEESHEVATLMSAQVSELDWGESISNYSMTPEQGHEVSTLVSAQVSDPDWGEPISNSPVDNEEDHQASTPIHSGPSGYVSEHEESNSDSDGGISLYLR